MVHHGCSLHGIDGSLTSLCHVHQNLAPILRKSKQEKFIIGVLVESALLSHGVQMMEDLMDAGAKGSGQLCSFLNMTKHKCFVDANSVDQHQNSTVLAG